MATVEDLLVEAAQFPGYTECGEPDHHRRFPRCPGKQNHTRFHDELGLPSGPEWPWCLIFWMAIAKRVGLKLPLTASTRQLWAWAQEGKYGLKVVPAGQARRGDFGMFDFPGGHTPTDHIEGLLEVIRPGLYRTLGANTSPDDGGSQSNGGGVFVRTRSAHIRGFIRPPYTAAPSAPPQRPEEDDMPVFDQISVKAGESEDFTWPPPKGGALGWGDVYVSFYVRGPAGAKDVVFEWTNDDGTTGRQGYDLPAGRRVGVKVNPAAHGGRLSVPVTDRDGAANPPVVVLIEAGRA